MNQKAGELGLENTHFVTPHGLDENEHYTTAHELAKIANYALKNEEFAKIVRTEEYTVTINGRPKSISNTNELLGYLNGVYGIKTGFTNGANRCLVTACKRGDLDIITVVLGADTKKDRTKDSIKLIEYTFKNYQMVDLGYMLHEEFNKIVENTQFNIVKGITNDVELILEENNIANYPIKKDVIKDIFVRSNIETNQEAPIQEKAKLGKIEIGITNDKIFETNILTKKEIKKKGVTNYLKELMEKLHIIRNRKLCNKYLILKKENVI